MGAWSFLLALGLFVVFVGLFTHWSIVLLGAVLPFLPVVSELLRRRRSRYRPPPDQAAHPPS
jgi:hypothetical protein